MPPFDFVVDRDMRLSLDSDSKELEVALCNSAWKAVHILAGSIVEAILIDHLLSISYKAKDPLKMTLDEAITACKAEGILSDKTAELSTIIRRFRNLIHPGRSVRLADVPDVHSANVAQSLVSMIVNEIANAKKQTYGYTAEQIASKVERDASAIAILSHLLKKINARELERLLLEVLPERYSAIEAQHWETEDLSRIERTFHASLDVAGPETKKAVARRFMKVLHEEDGETVARYERVFFRAAQLEYLDADDVRAVKQHLIAELKERPGAALFAAAFGIGKHLVQSEVSEYVDVAVKVILDPKKKDCHSTCDSFINDLFISLPPGPDAAVNKRLGEWVAFLKGRNRDADAARIESIVVDDFPF